MNASQLHRLIARTKAGDERAFSQIVDAFWPLILRSAASLYIQGGEREDLYQAGRIGLWLACQNYRLGKATFGAFAEICVMRRMISVVVASSTRKYSPLNGSISIDACVEDHSGNGADQTYADFVSDTAHSPEDQVITEAAAQALLEHLGAYLTGFEAAVIAEVADGLSYAQIAEALGLNQKQVDNVITRVRVKAREIGLGSGTTCPEPKPAVHPPPVECPRCGNKHGLEVSPLENGGDWEIACFLCGNLWWTRRRIATSIEKYRVAGSPTKNPE